MCLKQRIFTAGLIVIIFGVTPAAAFKHTISVTAADVSSHSPADTTLGEYYTLQFQFPSSIKAADVEMAWLEFYVDAGAFGRDLGSDSSPRTYVSDAPAIEVYALTSDFAGQLDMNQLDGQSKRVRPVPVGAERRVKVEITRLIKSYMKNPSGNYGLIVGSLTGLRDGDFTLKQGKFPDGAVAQVHLYFMPKRGSG